MEPSPLSAVLPQIVELLAIAILSVLGLLLRAGVAALKTYLEAKLGVTQLEQLKSIASTVVRALAQSPIFENLDPSKKKEMAVVAISQYCADHNIPLDAALIDRVIEEAVQIMKAELPLDFFAEEIIAG